MDFPHRVLEGEEEKAVIDDLMARIPTLNKAGDKERWEQGWRENLEAYRRSGDIADLRPRYIRANQPVRLKGKFVMAEDPDIEAKWYEWFFAQIAQKWLADAQQILEFGCGSCHNIATLARAWPDKMITGFDWSDASWEICETLHSKGLKNVLGGHIDFFNPPLTPSIVQIPTTVIFTVGALEQTGTRWRPFLDYMLSLKPRRVVHLEPIVEWYWPLSPVDATAVAAHDARGFWRGYYAALNELCQEGHIVIEEARRTGFGSLWIEGYSTIVWKPT